MNLILLIESIARAVLSLVRSVVVLAVGLAVALGLILFAIFYFNYFAVIAVGLFLFSETRQNYRTAKRNRGRKL